MSSEMLKLLIAATEHAESLKVDILLCKTREEHIRMTARANEAATLVENIKKFIGDDGE